MTVEKKTKLEAEAALGARANPGDKALVFDICGVLYDVSGGNRRMLEWLGDGYSEQQMLKKWVLSEPVRQVELGRISNEEFARRVVDDLGFPMDPDAFLGEYDSWHRGPYEGAVELVRELSKKYVTATLSNISEFQWSKIRASGIPDHVKFNFISCEIGCVKPDREAFDHAARTLGRGPAGFYFFDDNRVNVEAAAGFGIPAFLTRGIGELKRTLSDLGIAG